MSEKDNPNGQLESENGIPFISDVYKGQSTSKEVEIMGDVEVADKRELWDRIGFHRPLAGFWNNFIYQIGVLIIPALIAVQLMRVLYPFPESKGYSSAITGIFVLVFTLFDLGTASTISRFIADENIKNPTRMVQYIQYFIWYQAITGLIQITGISVWALYFCNKTDLAYGIWIMLVVSTKQWPGFPGAFKGVLNALQMFDKKNAIEFFQGEGIQVLTEIGFILLGKWYGRNNPEIGEILGIALGATFGLYFDDIIASFIAAYFLAKALEPYGITFRRLFTPEFSWDIVKECTIFGVKMGLPGVLFASTKLVSLSLMLNYLPQYTTFAALAGLAGQLVAMVDRLVYQDFTPIFTETYQNGKKNLCQYYHAHSMRFFMMNTGFALCFMLIVISIFEEIFIGVGLENYLLTIPFLIPCLINRVVNPYKKYPGGILVAAHRPNQLMVLNLSFEALKLLVWFLTVAVFKIQDLGIGGVIYVLILTEFPVEMIKLVVIFIYIDRTIFKLKMMWWQGVAVPLLSTLILYGIFLGLKNALIDRLWSWSFWGTLIVGIIFMVILVLGLYFPLTMLLGGWDDNSVRDLKAAVKMCGHSRIIVVPLTKLLFKVMPYSKLHNKFKYDESGAFEELMELNQIRELGRQKTLKK